MTRFNTTSGIDFAAELNAEQLAAVTAPPGPALVIAGAGSGKNRALTYRVAWLLDQGIPPYAILLLTFTNKAAREMIERVQNLIPSGADGLWSGTFHSIGNRILRGHAEDIGFPSNFSIMDREDSEDMISALLSEANIVTTGRKFPKAGVLSDIFSYATNTTDPIRSSSITTSSTVEPAGTGAASPGASGAVPGRSTVSRSSRSSIVTPPNSDSIAHSALIDPSVQ